MFSRSTDLWGIDQWRYLPGSAVILLLILGLLPLVPSVRRRLADIAERVDASRFARSLGRRPSIWLPLLLAAAALLLWSFRQATHFLGDGDLWLKTIETGRQCRSWDLVVPCSLYRAIWRFIGMLGGFDARATAGMISVASGLVFLLFAWKTALQLLARKGEQVFLLLALLSTGSVMLFFGYIEAYPPAAAAMMIYLYYASRSLMGVGRPHAAAVACAAAILLHPSMIALLPSLLLLYIFERGRDPGAGGYIAAVSITVAMGLAALVALQRWRLFGGYFHESFLPILTGGVRNRVPYPALSGSGLVDLLNELLLVCPLLLFSAALLRRRGSGVNKVLDRRTLFFGTASLYFILTFIVGNKLLGASRDWDVFAPMALPLALFTSVLLLNRYRRNVSELALLAGFVIALHTVPWILINASTDLSLRRFADLSFNARWSGFARGYACDELGTYYFYNGDMPRAIVYSIAAVEADPGNVRYLYNAATRHMMAGGHDDAVRMFENLVERSPDYLDARLNLGTIYMSMERFQDARNEFLEAVRIDSTSAAACCKLAHSYWKEDRQNEASELYERAIGLDPRNPEAYLNLALLRLNTGGTVEARGLMERAIDVDPDYALTHYHLGKMHAMEGDMEKALEHYGMYVSLDPAALDARFEMAVILDRTGRMDEALGHLLFINRERPGDVMVLNNMGVIYSRRGEFDRAVRVFEEALGVDPNQSGVLVNVARVYYRLGDYPTAWSYVMRAERLGGAVPGRLRADLERVMTRPGTP